MSAGHDEEAALRENAVKHYGAVVEALRRIEIGLVDTGIVRDQWVSPLLKQDAWRIAHDALKLAGEL
jgi:hypothetical protein